MSKINIGGINFHVQQFNESAPESVIMIHGLGYGSLAVWYFNIAPVISEKFRVVMYDHKSHGMSDRTKTGYDLERMSNDLAALMDNLGIEKTSLTGFSYGALVALHFAIRFPERVQKLALIESPDPGDKNEEAFTYASKNHISISDEMRNILFPEHILEISGKGKRHIKKQNATFEFLVNESTLARDIYNLPPFDSWQTRKVNHPTLVIYGENSICKPMAEKLQRRIKHAELKFYEGDHGILTKHSSAIANDLKFFFTK